MQNSLAEKQYVHLNTTILTVGLFQPFTFPVFRTILLPCSQLMFQVTLAFWLYSLVLNLSSSIFLFSTLNEILVGKSLCNWVQAPSEFAATLHTKKSK